MKAFYSTMLLFILTVLLIFSNSARVSNFTSNAEEKLKSLSFSADKELFSRANHLSNEIRVQIKSIEFSIPHSKTSQLFQKLDLLSVYAKALNQVEFEATKSELLNIISEISDLEKMTFSGRSFFYAQE